MTELDRRSFLRLAGAAGLAAMTGCVTETPASTSRPTTSTLGDGPSRDESDAARGDILAWSDPATWDTNIPGPKDVAQISRPVLLDVDTLVAGVIIEEGGSLSFDPGASHTLESSGNVVVYGRLSMRPANGRVTHILRFVDIDESRYLGAAMTTMDSDVGLWVLPAGLLDVRGTTKLPWTRAVGDLKAGDRVLRLTQPPIGWETGDEIVVVPTAPPGTEADQAFEEHHIESIDGAAVRLRAPLAHEHPAVEVGRNRVLTAEILNLTRNAILAGTPEGRAHTIILGGNHAGMSTTAVPQQAGYFRLEHMGPYNSREQPLHFADAVEASRPLDSETREPMEIPVLARWPFHFHHVGDASRGSLIEGAVASRPSSHAFVAHESHGVTFESCIAYDAITSPFWWDGDGLAPDPRLSHARPPDRTLDGHYRNCVAAKVRMFDGIDRLTFAPVWAPGWGPDDIRYPTLRWPAFSAHRLGAFTLVKRDGRISGGVAAGVEGPNSGGIVWPEAAAGVRWDVEDLVVHNNGEHGTFGWQNTSNRHSVRRLVSYHNRRAGMFHGAYSNPYLFEDCISHGNGTAVEWHANAADNSDIPQEWIRLLCDGNWVSRKHSAGGSQPTVYRECQFLGEMRFLDRGGLQPAVIDFIDCSLDGRPLTENDLNLSEAHPDNRISIRRERESPTKLSDLPALPLPSMT